MNLADVLDALDWLLWAAVLGVVFSVAAAALAALSRLHYKLFKRPGYRRHEVGKREAEEWYDRRKAKTGPGLP